MQTVFNLDMLNIQTFQNLLLYHPDFKIAVETLLRISIKQPSQFPDEDEDQLVEWPNSYLESLLYDLKRVLTFIKQN